MTKEEELVRGLSDRVKQSNGDLEAAGAFSPSTLEELSQAVRGADLWTLLRVRLQKAGVSPKHLESLHDALLRWQRGDGFRLRTAEELRDLPPLEFLVEGILLRRQTAFLFGPSGCGKTFVALDLAASVVAGLPWHGHPVEAGRVVYLAAEGCEGLHQRLEGWKSLRGVARLDDLLVLDRAVDLRDWGQIAELMSLLAEQKPLLLVIDTLARCIPGADENSSKDVGVVNENLRRIARDLGVSPLVVHHTGKSGESERGSSALRGAADTMIQLSRAGEGVIEFRCDKQRDGADGERIRFTLRSVCDSLVPTVQESIDAPSGLAPSQIRLLQDLWGCFGIDPATDSQMKEVTGLAKRTFYQTKKALLNDGFLTLASGEPGRRGATYSLTEKALGAIGAESVHELPRTEPGFGAIGPPPL